MGYMNEFPHSRMFDSDLREIIELYFTVKDLPERFATLEEYVENYFSNLDLQKEVDRRISEMVADGTFGTMFSDLSTRIKRRMILMADSWGTYDGFDGKHYSWTESVKTSLDSVIGSENIINISMGSRGFVYNPVVGTFLNGLQNREIENPSTVTDVYVLAGTNDMFGIINGATTYAEIKDAIREFVEYCKGRFPNAIVTIGCVGNHYNSRDVVKQVRNAYKECVKYGARYATNIEYICDSSRFLDASAIHPTGEGFENLAYYITNYILGSPIDVVYEQYDMEYAELAAPIHSQNTPILSYKQNNNIYNIGVSLDGTVLTFREENRPLLSEIVSPYHLLTYKDFQFVAQNYMYFILEDVPTYFLMGDGKVVSCRSRLQLIDKKLSMNVLLGTIDNPDNSDLSNTRILGIGFNASHTLYLS